jgi:hypothetical protein
MKIQPEVGRDASDEKRQTFVAEHFVFGFAERHLGLRLLIRNRSTRVEPKRHGFCGAEHICNENGGGIRGVWALFASVPAAWVACFAASAYASLLTALSPSDLIRRFFRDEPVDNGFSVGKRGALRVPEVFVAVGRIDLEYPERR